MEPATLARGADVTHTRQQQKTRASLPSDSDRWSMVANVTTTTILLPDITKCAYMRDYPCGQSIRTYIPKRKKKET